MSTNLSYVVHERSDSRAVSEIVAACEEHALRIAELSPRSFAGQVIVGDLDRSVTTWLSAMIGIPHLFLNTVRAEGAAGPHVLVRVDALDGPITPVAFFRANAGLVLPLSDASRVGVGGLVLRPDGQTTQLALFGTFDWPIQHLEALRAVERLIQTYCDQWMPERALWAAPAEVLLSDEIG